MQIQGTIALVTGANRGIGKAFAEALLERGAAKVYAAVRDVATVSDADPRLVPVQLDVTDADRVGAVARELGDIQLVVNNAGIARPGTPLTTSPGKTQDLPPMFELLNTGATVNTGASGGSGFIRRSAPDFFRTK